MLYFRVKKEHDNKTYGKKTNEFYIEEELFTANEVKRKKLNLNYLTAVEINKNDTFYFFGSRKSKKIEYNQRM